MRSVFSAQPDTSFMFTFSAVYFILRIQIPDVDLLWLGRGCVTGVTVETAWRDIIRGCVVLCIVLLVSGPFWCPIYIQQNHQRINMLYWPSMPHHTLYILLLDHSFWSDLMQITWLYSTLIKFDGNLILHKIRINRKNCVSIFYL